MQKIWLLKILGLIVPKKKVTKHFFYLYSSNGNPINKHLCTNTSHRFTLSPNNLMLKLNIYKQSQNDACAWQFHYHNPMDIRNLLNYPEEQVTAYTPDVDDVIEDQL